MNNYETMIIDHLIGTPKEKYEYLLKLEKENAEMKGALYNAALGFESLSKTANEVETLSSVKSIFETYRDVLSKYKQKIEE
jgi:hypothetical protein